MVYFVDHLPSLGQPEEASHGALRIHPVADPVSAPFCSLLRTGKAVLPVLVPVAAVLANRGSRLAPVLLLKVCVSVPVARRLLLLQSVLLLIPFWPAVYPAQFLFAQPCILSSSCLSSVYPVSSCCPAVHPVSSCLFQYKWKLFFLIQSSVLP